MAIHLLPNVAAARQRLAGGHNRFAVLFTPDFARKTWLEAANRNAVVSIPDVPFIPFDVVAPKQRPHLVLKVYLSMMLFLISYIFLNLLEV